MMISAETRAAIEAHVVDEYPREACGLIVDGAFVRCPNIAREPEQNFAIASRHLIAAGDKLEAILHSHPNGPAYPSASDMQGQLASAKPWIIVVTDGEIVDERWVIWGDKLPIAPLIGRPFMHGVHDCYSLIRDIYRLGRDECAKQGIDWPFPPVTLMEGVRDNEWWTKGEDLYLENFKRAGFSEVSAAVVRPGDVFLMKIRSDKHNHGGVLLANGELLHHLPTRLSRREPVGKYGAHDHFWIRHEIANA